MLFQPGAELLVDGLRDEALDLAVAQLGLGLAFELRLGHPDGDDGGQALADVVAGGGVFSSFSSLLRSWRSC